MTSSIDFLPKFGIAVELALGLGDEVADRLDPRPLEAVVGAHAELELLDEDVVHRRAAAGGRRAASAAPAPAPLSSAAMPPGPARSSSMRSSSVKIDSDEIRISAASRSAACGIDRAVGLDVERQLVEVGPLADARLLDRVRDAAHRREDRVDRDDADRLVGRLVVLGRAVPAAAADRQVHLELGLLLERGDVRVRVEDLDARGQVDVAAR